MYIGLGLWLGHQRASVPRSVRCNYTAWQLAKSGFLPSSSIYFFFSKTKKRFTVMRSCDYLTSTTRYHCLTHPPFTTCLPLTPESACHQLIPTPSPNHLVLLPSSSSSSLATGHGRLLVCYKPLQAIMGCTTAFFPQVVDNFSTFSQADWPGPTTTGPEKS